MGESGVGSIGAASAIDDGATSDEVKANALLLFLTVCSLGRAYLLQQNGSVEPPQEAYHRVRIEASEVKEARS